MVPVGALIIRTDTPFRDEVGFLCQPAVTVIPVKIVRVTGDTVIRPHAEGAVRVQLRVGQAVARRVRGIRDADIQIRCGGVNAGQPAGGAVAVTPGLARAADADEFAVVVPGVIAVILQAVQVLTL
ncbi:Uncharacterised protein [Escherichia coli]|nr:Uncharacterised protein [Escherichia coli]